MATRLSRIIFILSLNLSGSLPIHAESTFTPDIIANLVAAQVANEQVSFTMEFRNTGINMADKAYIYSKVFLIPKGPITSLTNRGIVLSPVTVEIKLDNGAATRADFTLELPHMTAGEYFIGATINTRALRQPYSPSVTADYVPEENKAQLNNVTEQMIDLGMLPAIEKGFPHGKYDLYHEAKNASFNLQAGTANHRSRNILRVMEGSDRIPDKSYWDDEISARFLLINPVKGTLKLLPYTANEVDKLWTSIAWYAELDQSGRNQYVDYYANAPMITGIKPGSYYLGVLLNVADHFTLDSNPHNNLDLTKLDLSCRRALSIPSEVWLSMNDQYIQPLMAQYWDPSVPIVWSYRITDKPSWLIVQSYSTPFGHQFDFNKSNGNAAPVGIHRFALTISASLPDGTTLSQSSRLTITRNDAPIPTCQGLGEWSAPLDPQSPGVALENRNDIRYMTITFDLKNTGTQTLHYSFSAAQNTVIFKTPSQTVLEPSNKHMVQFTIPLVGIAMPRQNSMPSNLGMSIATNIGERYCSLYCQLLPPKGGSL